MVSQAASLELTGGKAKAKRQTEYGYDVIEAPLPCVVAVSDAINEPRYPSLKGIMGAKKKPFDTVSAGDLGLAADEIGEAGSRTVVLALADPPARGDSMKIEDEGDAAGEDPRVPVGEEAGLVATPRLLEDHEGELVKGSLGVLSKAAQLGDDVAAVVAGSGVEGLAPQAGRYGAKRVFAADDAALAAPLPQPRVDVLAKLVEDQGFDTVLFGASVLAADVAAGLAARLGAGLNWDLVDLELRDGALVGKRPALQDSVFVEVGWKGEPRLALVRSGTFEPTESGGDARGRGRGRRDPGLLTRARPCSSARTRRARVRPSRTPT